jgi:hypothetical protein
VSPTISGTIVDHRDHVLSTVFSPERFIASTFLINFGSIAGPFLVDLDISAYPFIFYLRPRRFTISLSEALGLRVLYPRAGLPQGVLGPGIPIGLLPSPPPWGWSRGVIAEPLTVGLMPSQRFRPALPSLIPWWSRFPT